jgi:thiol-disulfide isomerase/thioredoxin
MNVVLLLLLLARSGELLPEGARAPAIDARGADGRAWGQDFEGRITLVDFFATWCPHCRRSLADHDRLMELFGDRVRLVIIDVDEEPALVRAFFARHKPPPGAEIVLDRSKATSRAWRVTGFPTMYVVDRSGVVRSGWSGWGEDSLAYLSELIPSLENERPGPSDRTGGRARKRLRGAPRNAAVSSISDDARARAMGVEVLH